MQILSVVGALSLFGLLAGCDLLDKKPAQPALTYSNCLQSAIAGSHLPVQDIRSLCAEAAQVIDAHYSYQTDGTITPSDDFTRCYDLQLKDYKARNLADATRLAKLSCKYPEVK